MGDLLRLWLIGADEANIQGAVDGEQHFFHGAAIGDEGDGARLAVEWGAAGFKAVFSCGVDAEAGGRRAGEV